MQLFKRIGADVDGGPSGRENNSSKSLDQNNKLSEYNNLTKKENEELPVLSAFDDKLVKNRKGATLAKVLVNKIPVDALIDSGATKSVARHSLAIKAELELVRFSDQRTWRLADNSSRLKLIGTVSARLDFEGEVIDHELVISDSLAYDLIVGVDLLERMNGVIDFGRKTLKINKRLVDISCGTSCKTVAALEDIRIEPLSWKVVWLKPQHCGSGSLALEPMIDQVLDALVEGPGDIPVVIKNPASKELVIPKDKPLAKLVEVDECIVEEDEAVGSLEVGDGWRPSDHVILDKEYLKPEEIQRIKELIDSYQDIFSKNDEDLGLSIFTHKIKLTDETPIKSRPYRVPYMQLKEVEKHIDQMLRMGVIRKSESPWASPIVMVRKQDGTLRFCVDFRKINERTIKDSYPMPLIEDRLNGLSGCDYFSTLDMASGYWQIKMDKDSIDKTAFCTHQGLFEFTVMAFGMCNAGASFQRAMDITLEGLDSSSPYIDDVITHSQGFEKHFNHLKEVFERIRSAKFKVKTSKCRFGFRETKYLGLIVGKDGIKMDPSRTEAIRKYPVPKNGREVRRFLGLASYYRKFIPDFAKIAVPLYYLTKKNVRFKWDDLCQKSFKTLIESLISPQVLAYPKFDLPFVLTTDASGIGLGAVLSQVQDGEERVICFSSRALKAAEKNYSTIERELLAIVWATQLFRPYLYNSVFTIVTDHNPLVYLNNLTISSNRLTKWRLRLAEYKFEVKYKKGEYNVNADSLSRVEPEIEEEEVEIATLFEEAEPEWLEKLRKEQRNDPEISKLIKDVELRDGRFNNFIIENSLLFCTRKSQRPYRSELVKRLVIPFSMRNDVLTLCHDGICGGHLGEKKTWWKLSEKYYWPSAFKDTLNWVESCGICAARKTPPNKRADLNPILEFEGPFDVVGVDILGPLPTTDDGNKYVVVFSDYLSKWPEAFALKDAKAETIARVFVEELICRHSAPVKLLSDQGRNFMSEVIAEVCRYFSVNKINSTAYRPQTNGLTERFNRTLCEMLSSFINDRQTDWDKYLPIVLFAYRVSSQSSTGETPFTLLYGRDARFPSDLDLGRSNYVINLREAWVEAKRMIKERAIKEKLRYDRPNKVIFRSGDQVRILMPAVAIGLKQKLRNDKWQGPFKVLEVAENGNVIVDKNGKPYRVHEDRVKHLEPTRELSSEKTRKLDEKAGDMDSAKTDRVKMGKPTECSQGRPDLEVPYRTSRYGRKCYRVDRLGVVPYPIKGY